LLSLFNPARAFRATFHKACESRSLPPSLRCKLLFLQ
jgi:hypothetical protein